MPHRVLVANELEEMLGVLARPNRILIIEELRDGEHDVNSLQAVLGISHSGVSQHLMLLRAHRLVRERRQGRQVLYRLRHPELAAWLMEAMSFMEEESIVADQLRQAIKKTRVSWATDNETK